MPKTPDRLTPLHKRRAEGETRVGTKVNPPATSSNPAVKRFQRGGHVTEAPMGSGKIKPTSAKDDSKTRALSMREKKGGPVHKAKGGSVAKFAEGGSVTKGVRGW